MFVIDLTVHMHLPRGFRRHEARPLDELMTIWFSGLSLSERCPVYEFALPVAMRCFGCPPRSSDNAYLLWTRILQDDERQMTASQLIHRGCVRRDI